MLLYAMNADPNAPVRRGLVPFHEPSSVTRRNGDLFATHVLRNHNHHRYPGGKRPLAAAMQLNPLANQHRLKKRLRCFLKLAHPSAVAGSAYAAHSAAMRVSCPRTKSG